MYTFDGPEGMASVQFEVPFCGRGWAKYDASEEVRKDLSDLLLLMDKTYADFLRSRGYTTTYKGKEYLSMIKQGDRPRALKVRQPGLPVGLYRGTIRKSPNRP